VLALVIVALVIGWWRWLVCALVVGWCEWFGVCEMRWVWLRDGLKLGRGHPSDFFLGKEVLE
jgi:hypothetical protein